METRIKPSRFCKPPFAGFNSQNRFCTFLLSKVKHCELVRWSKWRIHLEFSLGSATFWPEKFKNSNKYHQSPMSPFFICPVRTLQTAPKFLILQEFQLEFQLEMLFIQIYFITYLVLVPKMVYEKMVYPVLQMDTKLSLRLIWTSSVAEVPVDQVLNL